MIIKYTYIFRFFTVLFLTFATISCSSDDTTPAPVTNDQNNGDPGNQGNNGSGGTGGTGGTGGGTIDDPDGDGVETTVEIGENTDPQDPCSYILASQDYTITTQEWRDLDCDGDGVINGQEVDPDNDGQNNGNGTDPLDLCSFIQADQTVPPSQEWRLADCDADCQNNGVEEYFGTDPLDPNSTFDFTDKLETVYENETSYSINSDNQNLTNIFYPPFYYQSYQYENGVLIKYSAGDIDQGAFVICNFSYNNDMITSIAYDFTNITVEYDANTITTYHEYSPQGLFATRLELDPISGRIIRMEKFKITPQPDEYDFQDITFEYDAAMENLTKTTIEDFNYDATNDTYTQAGTSTFEYNYFENILNPSFSAYSKLELPFRLSEIYAFDQTYAILGGFMPEDAHFSKNLLKEAIAYYGITTYTPNVCSEENSYPFVITRTFPSGNSNEIRFLYSRF